MLKCLNKCFSIGKYPLEMLQSSSLSEETEQRDRKLVKKKPFADHIDHIVHDIWFVAVQMICEHHLV